MNTNKGNILKISVIFVSFAMVTMGFVHISTDISSADDDEVVEAPEWKQGYRWEYEARMDPDPDEWRTFSETVISTNVPVEPDHPEEDVEYEESYHVARQGERRLDYYYEKDSLSLILEDPEGGGMTFFHPPRADFNFPFQVGDTWNRTTHEFYEDRDGDVHGPESILFYNGTVEKQTTVGETRDNPFVGSDDIPLDEESELYKLNVSISAKEEDEDEWTLGRIEYYYSPEVKNDVLTMMWQTRLDEHGLPDERLSGNEVLQGFELEEEEVDLGDEETSMLGFGVVLLIIGVATASFFVYKKVKSSFL